MTNGGGEVGRRGVGSRIASRRRVLARFCISRDPRARDLDCGRAITDEPRDFPQCIRASATDERRGVDGAALP